MKKVLLFLAAALMLPAMADEACKTVSEYAGTVMDARQKGVDAAKLIEIAEANKNPKAASIMRKIVIEAFKTPQFNTDEHRERAVSRFKNDIYISCIDD